MRERGFFHRQVAAVTAGVYRQGTGQLAFHATSLRGARPARQRQQGIALVVALVLLLVITLVGLAAVRGTIMQQKMSANLYDREIAFQSAEAALRTAAALVPSHPALIARNCRAGGTVCLTNPFSDTLPAGSIHDLSTTDYAASSLAAGQPQYVVENMGNWADPSTDTGYGQTANSHNYGAQGLSSTSVYYRITARSSDPAKTGDRAVVVLQAVIKQG